MLWLTWRQHRIELLVAAVLFAIVAIPLVVSGLVMHREYESEGVAACVADPASRSGCAELVARFFNRHSEWGNRLLWAAGLPVLVGIFVGAPLLAREFEYGTWRLAFTQTVSRIRWLATKLVLVGICVAVVTFALAALLTWWRGPLNAIDGRMGPASFVIAGPSLTSAALFAFAAGVLAGALVQRTVAAMATTLTTFLAVRLALEEYVRPHYRKPLVRIADPAVQPNSGWQPNTDWTVRSGWIDRAGHVLTEAEEGAIIEQVYGGDRVVYGADTPIERYMVEHGLRHYTQYHPDSSYPAFQLIESGWFLGLAAILLTASVWVVRRRV